MYLETYLMDEHPVTNAEYKQFIDETGHAAPYVGKLWSQKYDWIDNTYPEGKANHPVVLVTFEDALAFCQWAGKRLPTEAEWEKAARGTDGRTWPWGNTWDREKCACGGMGATTTVECFDMGKSPFGCLHMAGNVWEWTADWYDDQYYKVSETQNPPGPDAGQHRVLKGGAWIHGEFSVRCAMRFHKAPDYCDNYIGFRCAKSV